MANAAHATYRVPVDAEYVVRLITSGRRPQGSMPMRFGLWLDGTMVGEQELDPSLGAGFEPGEQELSGRRVEFRLKLKAGEHWIAGTPLRLYEGLPAKFGGPAPSTLPPPPKPEFKPRPGMTPEQIEFAKKRFEARLTERMVINTPRVGGIEVIGPYGYDGRPSPESQARIFTCRHAGPHVAACRLPIVSRLARRAYRRPVTKDEVARLVVAGRARRERDGLVRGRPGVRGAGDPRVAGLPLPHRARRAAPRDLAPGNADRHPPDPARARLAPVLFPVGQHARRGPRRRRRSRRAAPAGRAHGAGQADAGRPAVGDAGRALRRPVAAGARARVRVARSREVPRLRPLPPHVDAARDRAVRRRDRARGSQHPRLPRRQVHVPERAAGASLRHRRRERHRLPPGRAAGRRRPRRRHHAGERADGVLLRDAHLAGAARPLDPRQHPGRAAAGAAARHPEPRRQGRRHRHVGAAAAGTASRRPDLRVVPQADGSARLRPRELRRHRRLAHGRRPGADRRVGHAAGRPHASPARRNCARSCSPSATRSRARSPAS